MKVSFFAFLVCSLLSSDLLDEETRHGIHTESERKLNFRTRGKGRKMAPLAEKSVKPGLGRQLIVVEWRTG